MFIANAENVCNLIGQEEYSIGYCTLDFNETSRPHQHSTSAAGKCKNLLVKIIIINQKLSLYKLIC